MAWLRQIVPCFPRDTHTSYTNEQLDNTKYYQRQVLLAGTAISLADPFIRRVLHVSIHHVFLSLYFTWNKLLSGVCDIKSSLLNVGSRS